MWSARPSTRRRAGTELHAVHVLRTPVVYVETGMNLEVLAVAERKSVWEPLDEVLSSSPVPVTKVDLDGYPPDTLVGYAGDMGASAARRRYRGPGSARFVDPR